MASLIHGVVEDRRLVDVLSRILQFVPPSFAGIVRCMDSDDSEQGLVWSLGQYHVSHEVCAGNVCLSIDGLKAASAAGVFTGFDEVWIVPASSRSYDLAGVPTSTSDGTDFSTSVPVKVSCAAYKAGCILILADGCGLNYATTDERIGAAIRS